MDYEVAFEMSTAGLGTGGFALPGFLAIAIGVLMVKFPEFFSLIGLSPLKRGFVTFWLGFSILWTAIALGATMIQQASVRKAYKQGRFEVVEGVVENFDPMPASGHKKESFSVNGVKFDYSDFSVTPGFNNAASRGGPIREGLRVRVSYIGNMIVKLEIAKAFD